MSSLATGLALTAFLGLLIVAGSRRIALAAMIAGIIYLPQSQGVEVVGFNLYPARFLEVLAFSRVALRREFSVGAFGKLDLAFLSFVGYTTIVFLLRSREATAFQIGAAVDAICVYFAFRGLVKGLPDLKWSLKIAAILLVPYVPAVLVESYTAWNPFSLIGGVENARAGTLWFREGRLRATGSFGHPSLLGTLPGVLLPLYTALWFTDSKRLLAVVGTALCLAVVWATNSGGPVLCVAMGLAGWALWPMRDRMRVVRLGLVVALVLLALVMKAPIWFLLARLSALTGGDGWHRSALIDIAIDNLDRWWFAGMRALDTANWMPYANSNTGAVDMTNQFLVYGIAAGIGSIVLFILVITFAYRELGKAMATLRRRRLARADEALLWGLGVALSVHVINWFGISYWDQTNLLWLMQLATIASVTASVTGRARRLPAGVALYRGRPGTSPQAHLR